MAMAGSDTTPDGWKIDALAFIGSSRAATSSKLHPKLIKPAEFSD